MEARNDIVADSGAEEAFTQAFQSHADAIFRHCYARLNDRELAIDVMQETFMKTWTYIAKRNDIKNIKAFLYHIASNLVINEALKRKRRGNVSLDALQEEGFDVGSNESVDDMRRLADEGKVLAVLQRVPSPYKEALILRYVDDLAPAEIAEMTGESANAISVRIHRGLAYLRPLLPS